MNDLTDPLKDMPDTRSLYTKAALQLTFLPENEQRMIYEIAKAEHVKLQQIWLSGIKFDRVSLCDNVKPAKVKEREPLRSDNTVAAFSMGKKIGSLADFISLKVLMLVSGTALFVPGFYTFRSRNSGLDSANSQECHETKRPPDGIFQSVGGLFCWR